MISWFHEQDIEASLSFPWHFLGMPYIFFPIGHTDLQHLALLVNAFTAHLLLCLHTCGLSYGKTSRPALMYRHDYRIFLARRRDQLNQYDAHRSVGFFCTFLSLLAFLDLNQSTLNSLAHELLIIR